MKWIFTIVLAMAFMACSTNQSEEILTCDRTVSCTLIGCNGEFFGTVDVPACETQNFVNGCCQPLPDITCNCPDS